MQEKRISEDKTSRNHQKSGLQKIKGIGKSNSAMIGRNHDDVIYANRSDPLTVKINPSGFC